MLCYVAIFYDVINFMDLGKSLADTQKSLSECGIRNGAKIMLIGKKVCSL